MGLESVLQGCGSTPVGLCSICGSAWLISFQQYSAVRILLLEKKKCRFASKDYFENVKHSCLTEILSGIQSACENVKTTVSSLARIVRILH